MNIKERYRRFKAWQLHAFDWNYDEHEVHHCVNCDNDFVGNHCPHCSQKAGMGKISWKSVMASTMEVWGMHNRSMLYSLVQLVFRPGYFISDYINGKRQVSFPPVKMLIIMGVISVVVDHIFVIHDATGRLIMGNSPLVKQFFSWLGENPGWGWLSMTCFFLIPTWCIFSYAPQNTKHSLPQGFFIQVFMSLQVLIVDDLADFFTDYFYVLVPMCYFYAYKQLFGYGVWGNLWRVTLMLATSFLFTMLAISITEVVTVGSTATFADEYKTIGLLLCLSVIPMLASMYVSKVLANRKGKKMESSE